MKEFEEYYKRLIGSVSPGLAGYLEIYDWSEGEDSALLDADGKPLSPAAPDYKVSLGNLPMPCPGCGRMRLNFHPDFHRIDCEKCFWVSGQILPDDEGESALKLSMLDKEDLKEIVRILENYVTCCNNFDCESAEGENTRRIVDRIKGAF